MNLAHFLARTARTHPERPAILHGTELVRTYGGFAERAARLARTLREEYGLRPGDRAALFMTNHPAYYSVFQFVIVRYESFSSLPSGVEC
ncbi:AMP-binding enzyme [Deinococcus reticulitermitis]|uniref:AMP-binding enzyme n=1 Tax=Deinococcus reticulitermitis TaxID=856736 RepID=A0A1H6Z2W8_9DEIO|nr:AMP-binding protein [Deinococcus reticulitermitis]SEJ47751.1 AMP-binding enzyme [Deinococcus reticulitermitis]